MQISLEFMPFAVLFSAFFCLNIFGQTTTALELNAPVVRELKSNERHFYSVTATKNEFVEIVCERKGVDVGLIAFAPNDEKISVSNAPSGFAGRDRLAFVAEKSGEYRIEISSRRPGIIVGKYTILLKDKRTANENDLTRADAMKLLGEAREILQGAENRYEKATKALEKLAKSVILFEKSNDLQGTANSLFQIAFIMGNEYGDEIKAIEYYEMALKIWQKIDDNAGKATCLKHAANELRDSGKREKSLAYSTEALLLDKKSNDKLGEAVTLSYLCRLYNDTGNFQKGFEACRESLQLGEQTDPLTDYVTYSNLGALYENTGDAENSLNYYQTSLARALLVKDFLNPIRPATIKGNIGIIFYRQKKYAEAIAYFQEVVSVGETVKRPLYSAYFLAQLSYIYLDLKEFEKALEYGEKSLLLYRQIAPNRSQLALNAVGKSYTALGKTAQAREIFSESLIILREKKDRYAESETLYNLAQLEDRAGNLELARQNIQQAINISEIIRADLLGKNQRSTYLTILKRFYELDIELLVKLYEKGTDEKYLEQAWQNQEKIRARSLLENFLENGFNLNDLELKDFFAKEQSLLEKISEAELTRVEAAKTKNVTRQNEAEKNLQKALDDYQVLQEEIRKKNPRFSALNQPQDFSFADAQNLLDNDTAFVEFALGEQQSYVWIIRKTSVKFVKLPSRNDINKSAREFYLALTDRNSKDETATIEKSKQLSRQILQPLSKEIANLKRLVIIADGSLQLVPFAALTLANDETFEPLAATMEIVNTPSFSSLVYVRENKANRQTSSNKLLAIFADPIFQDDDERISKIKRKSSLNSDETAKLNQTLRDFGVDRLARLPFSGIEAREIAKLAPQKTTLVLGANASRQTFLRGDFASYRILHFATHGFLNQQNPDLSGLVLSLFDENRNAQNGFLRVIDLYSLHLNADLVVLSACQTALGKDVDGEGIVGLTRGFMYAGASSVVSGLWKVEDAATAELMKRFYRAMLKENQTPAAALRIAQNEMRQIPRWRNPNNWAGFILTGEWQ
ncbi:CHAT domain-containing protein [soil metagenome]